MIYKNRDTGEMYTRLTKQEIKDMKEDFIVVLTRIVEGSKETLGELRVMDKDANEVFLCKTLELPWENNKQNKSCIPKGFYEVIPYDSVQYPDTFEVLNVPNRSNILIHWGNYYHNTEGCILVGENARDLNGDDVLDVTSSKATIAALKEATNNQPFRLVIV